MMGSEANPMRAVGLPELLDRRAELIHELAEVEQAIADLQAGGCASERFSGHRDLAARFDRALLAAVDAWRQS